VVALVVVAAVVREVVVVVVAVVFAVAVAIAVVAVVSASDMFAAVDAPGGFIVVRSSPAVSVVSHAVVGLLSTMNVDGSDTATDGKFSYSAPMRQITGVVASTAGGGITVDCISVEIKAGEALSLR
jgi:hypothetical protein